MDCTVSRALAWIRLALVLAAMPTAASAANYSDIWWNPAESGWGITLADHDTNIFGVWYTYRPDGRPVWYTIPGGTFSNGRQYFDGDVYITHGPPYTSAAFDSSKVVAMKVGTAHFDFAPPGAVAGTATFSYAVNGVSGTKQIQRQSFGNAAPQWGVDFTDLWFNPSESGWGFAIAQHGNNVFGVWYAYDVDTEPLWFVLPGVTFTSGSSFNGSLYTTTGPYFGDPNFDGSLVHVTAVGTASVSISQVGSSQAGSKSDAVCQGYSASFIPLIVSSPIGTMQLPRTMCPQPFGSPRPAPAAPANPQPKQCNGLYAGHGTYPAWCTQAGQDFQFNGSIRFDGVDWTTTGNQVTTLTVTNFAVEATPAPVGPPPQACTPANLPVEAIHNLPVNLSNGVAGLVAAQTQYQPPEIAPGTISYDLSVTLNTVNGHLRYDVPDIGGGGAYSASVSFSCTF